MKMLPVILGNFFKKSSTRPYPFKKRAPIAGFRGELKNNIDKCIFCKTCERVCPSRCLAVDKENATWTHNPFACVYCGMCEETCPTKCLYMEPVYKAPARKKGNIVLQGTVRVKKKKEEAPADSAQGDTSAETVKTETVKTEVVKKETAKSYTGADPTLTDPSATDHSAE